MTSETKLTAEVRGFWERASCGTTITSHPKFSKAYFDDVERFRYETEPFIHQFAQFSRWNGKDVLEVGVGAGTDFLQFARAGARVSGVDLTDEAIANVRNRLEIYDLKAKELRRCNAEELPFASDSFDLAYSWGVIHHAQDTWRVFSEIYRVTRPGGSVKLMIYNLSSLYTWYMWTRHALPRARFRHGRAWALHNYQESKGTKAYSERQVRDELAKYPHRDLRFSYFDQKLRTGARFHAIRSMVDSVCPDRLRWYMAFEFNKGTT